MKTRKTRNLLSRAVGGNLTGYKMPSCGLGDLMTVVAISLRVSGFKYDPTYDPQTVSMHRKMSQEHTSQWQ